MSEQATAPIAKTPTYWKHILIAEENKDAFEIALDDYGADGFEIVSHSIAIHPHGVMFFTAVMRRVAQNEEQIEIQQRRTAHFEDSL